MCHDDIKILPKHELHCNECCSTWTTKSAGQAEASAKAHIDEETQDSTNRNHTVVVRQITVIGRNAEWE